MHRLALALALVATLAACGDGGSGPPADTGDADPLTPGAAPTTPAAGTAADHRVDAVATVSPLADLVAQVLGERGTVAPLVPAGTDSHTYEPRPDDVAALADADVYFGNGLGLNDGALELAERTVDADVPVVRLAEEALGAEALAPPDHTHDGEVDHAHDEAGANPHTWMRVDFAAAKVDVIADVLADVDPAGQDAYRANAEAYRAELEALDRAIADAAATVPADQRTIVTFHDAYRYFGEAYGFEVVGAVQPSDFSEPSAAEVAALIDQVDAHDVGAVFGSAVFPETVTEQVAAETGASYVDDLRDDVLPGAPGDPAHSYMGLMAHNARVIVESLGGDPAALPGPG